MIVLDEEESDERYGWSPYRRPVKELLEYGFIPLDKPAGPTSHEVVAWVRKMLGVRKAGHSGTLDPPVTGLLPIGLGEATKALSILLLGSKEYYAVARLHSPVDQEKLRRVFSEFTGEIYQRPPQRASVKRATRRRWIYELEVVERKGNLLLVRVLCQAGTYVRKLIYDMGEALGPGATMVELRRTKVSCLSEAGGLVRLHDLSDAVYKWREEGYDEKLRRLVRPVEEMVSHLKSIVVRDSAVSALCHGAQLAVPGVLKLSKGISRGDHIAIYTLKGELVAIGEAAMATEEVSKSSRGIVAETRRVIMKPETYPRLWKTKKGAVAA